MSNYIDQAEEMQRMLALGIHRTGGHYVLSSGRHSEDYLDKTVLSKHPQELSRYCQFLAEYLLETRPEVIIGPLAVGGIMAFLVAMHLERMVGEMIPPGKPPIALFADKKGERDLVLKRGFASDIRGKTVAVVDDIVSTGGSLRRLVTLVQEAGGKVTDVCGLCSRGSVHGFDDIPRFHVPLIFTLQDYEPGPETCPGCAKEVPTDDQLGKQPVTT